MTEKSPPSQSKNLPEPPSFPLDEIKAAVVKVRYGSVQLIIQDGRIIQIETNEKRRLI